MLKQYNKQIPHDALSIIKEIEEAGFEAYIVGGCVRDLLMHRVPHDFDITTSAKPEDIKRIFKRTYDTGIKHGTVTVILNKEHYEVTTYRIEEDYKDFRHPEKVSFVEDIELDLSRRDFTMNAIAYHPTRGFIDPYNGREAIISREIISVRSAKERFTEDALRILRAVRFSAQLGFCIEKNTIEGIKACRHLLVHISKERIRDEFLKICISDRPEYITQLYDLKLLPYIIPEFEITYNTPQNHPYHLYNVAEHTLVAMKHIKPTVRLRLAMLLHDIGKPLVRKTDIKGIDHFYNHPSKSFDISKKVLRELKLDNKMIKEVGQLVYYHDYHISHKIDRVYIKKMLMEIGPELFDDLLEVQLADSMAQNLDRLEEKKKVIAFQKELKEDIIRKGEPYQKSMMVITGVDLIEDGFERGKELGWLLDQALLYIIKHPECNTKEALLKYCHHIYKSYHEIK